MKALFGGLIAVILLGLYVFAVVQAIQAAEAKTTDLPTGVLLALSMIGGLVSALVIAELSITKPGAAPAARLFTSHPADAPSPNAMKLITGAYLLVWVGAGLAAFVYGTMIYDKALQALTDVGQTWLGLAVAAAYAYFGIEPK